MQPGKRQRSQTKSNQVYEIDANVSQRSEEPIADAVKSLCEASPSAATTAVEVGRSSRETGKPSNLNGMASLQDEVREALRSVLRDVSASAAAKASAGRTLLEYFSGDAAQPGRGRRATELTADELDAEIARLTALKE